VSIHGVTMPRHVLDRAGEIAGLSGVAARQSE
jgi:hypothetical protein